MGIHGIYKEIGPGRRVALSKYAADHYIEHSRPLRLAIDISIWLFQIQSGKGGSNPALRTFYYRLLRILSLNIHPLFVFDGPNKPPFKRNKRVGGPNVKVSSIPEFLAKQLLKQFGFPMHLAPGEAEAECALLQREGIVDAVLSEDVDTLMFGSGTTMRSWSPEVRSSKVPTHVNVYDADTTKEGSGLDREGMILIALMSGGDYIPEGIPGCGPKTACEAARAGFGAQLCKLKKRDDAGFTEWRERLKHELWTNESKLFKQRRRLDIPEDFPNREVLGYYTTPCVSGSDKLAALRQSLRWDMPIDFPSLRSFTADAFDWQCIGGAKKFIRNLAPAILTRELRLRAEQGANDGDDLEVQASAEDKLVKAIHGTRTHASTDNMMEIRISFLPMDIIAIDLSQEPPEEEIPDPNEDDGDSDAPVNDDVDIESSCPPSPRKRGPSKYNPAEVEKIWMMDVFLRHGVPLKVQDWEASFKDARQYLAARQTAKTAGKKKSKATGGMPRGALDRFTRVTKPGVADRQFGKAPSPFLESVDLSGMPSSSAPARVSAPAEASASPPLPAAPAGLVFRRLGYSQARPVLDEVDLSALPQSRTAEMPAKKDRPTKRLSPDPLSPALHHRSKSETPKSNRYKQANIIDLMSSPLAVRKLDFTATPVKPTPAVDEDAIAPLPDTVTKRRKKSPFKRHETAPAGLGGLDADTEEMDLSGVGLQNEGSHDITLEARIEASTVGSTAQRPDLSRSKATEIIDLSLSSPATDSREALQVASRSTIKESLFAPFVAAAVQPPLEVPKETQVQKIKKKHYQLRESLEGAWKEVEVEMEVDLTSHTAGIDSTGGIMKEFTRPKSTRTGARQGSKSASQAEASNKDKERMRWRKSEVEVLDLTAE